MKNLLLVIASTAMIISCKQTANEAGFVQDTKSETIDSMKTVAAKENFAIAKQKSIDSIKLVMTKEQNRKVRTTRNVVSNSSSNNQVATTATPKRKKWSGAAKGAVIGAGVGVVAGAIIDKNHGEGAVIGGLAGAGIGAGTGAIIDSKK